MCRNFTSLKVNGDASGARDPIWSLLCVWEGLAIWWDGLFTKGPIVIWLEERKFPEEELQQGSLQVLRSSSQKGTMHVELDLSHWRTAGALSTGWGPELQLNWDRVPVNEELKTCFTKLCKTLL